MNELPKPAQIYILGIGFGGVALGAAFIRFSLPAARPWVCLVFVILTILGELRHVEAPVGASGIELTFSNAFAFALLTAFGISFAAIAAVLASAIADILVRKTWWKALFNASQFVFVSVAAGLVFHLVAGRATVSMRAPFSNGREIVAAICAAATYFTVNTVLLSAALSLMQHGSLLSLMRQEIGYQLIGNVGMFAVAPVAVVVADRSLWLVPVLMLPLVVSYRTTSLSVEKEHQALHDSLTGLPNRALFRLDALEATNGQRLGDGAAVMLMDLDRFKEINDTLGHGTGDKVLQELGSRLLAMLRQGSTIARLGGDEFGIVVPELESPEEAEQIAQRVLDMVRQPITLDGLELEVGASIGIALQGEHGDDADTLIQHADVAMYSAKDSGSGFAFYSAALDHTSPMRLGLVAALRQAIEGDALVVHYHPKISVTSGLVCGAEALVRWDHPIRGVVSPDEFIPVAEQSGLVRELTKVVLKEAIASNARLRQIGYDIPISVNISARTLHDFGLAATVADIVDQHGIRPSDVVLEITETTIMENPARAIAELEQLREIGVRISMDDFGTGHSSLAQMKSLPIDELKIDKSFITEMTQGSRDALIAASSVDLARRLGMKVVAEGVETNQVLQMLHEMGCDEAQGFYFTAPIPEVDFFRWLQEHDRRAARTSSPIDAVAWEAFGNATFERSS
jgi:diguanylate cyclase (GGDEF)-like protein